MGAIWEMSAEVRTVLLTTLWAAVIGAADWLVNHTVDRVVSVPTVQYELDTSRHADGQIVVTVQNLSRDHRFARLAFILRLPVGGVHFVMYVHPVEEAAQVFEIGHSFASSFGGALGRGLGRCDLGVETVNPSL